MDTVVDDPPDTTPDPPPPDATVRMACAPVTAPMSIRTAPMRARIAPTEPMHERLTYEVITPDDTLKERATLVDPPRMTHNQKIAFVAAVCFVVFGTTGLAIGACEERAATAPPSTTSLVSATLPTAPPPATKKR